MTPSPCYKCPDRAYLCGHTCRRWNDYLVIHEQEREVIRKGRESYDQPVTYRGARGNLRIPISIKEFK